MCNPPLGSSKSNRLHNFTLHFISYAICISSSPVIHLPPVNYYNEYDKKTAAWLRELIRQKLLPDGIVDERSIVDVRPSDLTGYTQCHFFAGIGGWSYALQLAGWPADLPVWTGSCPCQPFSTAGKGLAQSDERHLWPDFFNLIRECRPKHVFGEQVASAIGHGWLDGVSTDLEAEGYACGATVLGAHSVSAPHQRQRLYWVAHSKLQHERPTRPHEAGLGYNTGSSEADGLAQSESRHGRALFEGEWEGLPNTCGASKDGHRLEQPDSRRCELGEEQHSDTLPNPSNGGSRGQHPDGPSGHLRAKGDESCRDGAAGATSAESGRREVGGCWSDFTLVHCRDGKTRRIPTEPAFFPLAHGIPARVVRLRGYGNAIVPQCAQAFIEAFLDIQK